VGYIDGGAHFPFIQHLANFWIGESSTYLSYMIVLLPSLSI
jgi:hypothetical protein